MTFTYRPYEPDDREACLAIFHSNCPEFLLDYELEYFTTFLERTDTFYFVVISNGMIVGCGGFGRSKEPQGADFCWGLVHRDWHKKQVGRFLLELRIREIEKTTDAKFVRLGTSQKTQGFFQRFGFKIVSTKPDGFGPGLDEVEMRLELPWHQPEHDSNQ